MRDIQAFSATQDGDGHSAKCPFCGNKTRFVFQYGGLLCSYRSKCPHVDHVTKSASPNLMVFYAGPEMDTRPNL